MTFIRTRALLILFMLVCLAGVSPSAQSERARERALQQPVEAPDQPPTEEEISRRDIFRLMQDYRLPPGEVVPNLQTIFGNVTIEGHVQGDVVVVVGSARVTSTGVIDGSLIVVGGGAEIEPDRAVGRDLVVIGGPVTAPATFSPRGEHIVIGALPWLGDALRDLLPWMTRGALFGRLIVPDLKWVWLIVGVLFLVYLGLNTVFDRPVASSADAILERPLSAFVGGLLVLVLSVPVIVIVALSVIGLVVVPFLVCGLVVAGLIGKTAVCRAIGRAVVRAEIPESRIAALLAFAIGFVLLTLAYMVPILGFVTWALTTVLAFGGATVTFRSYLRRERKTVPPPPRPALAPTGSQDVPIAPNGEPSLPPLPPPTPAVIPPPPPVEPPPPPVFNQGLAQYPRATFLDRLAAFVLDVVLVAIANALLDTHRDDGLFFFLLLSYHIAFWAWKGTTLGGIICNLRVTRTDGADLRFVDSVVRGLSAIFSIAALGIGCLWMLQDPERQMWHDKIAGTLVVKVPRNLVLP